MVDVLDQVKKQIAWFKQEKPHYREILDLYALILEEQRRIRPQIRLSAPPLSRSEVQSRQAEGLPLLGREAFDIDLEAAQRLFDALSSIGQRATPKMGDEIPRITEAVVSGALVLRDLLSRYYDEGYLSHEAGLCRLDKEILSLLVKSSVKPSLDAQVEQLRGFADLETGLQRQCPLCGSAPHMAELRDDEGKRYLQCSFCGCQWRGERMACPYCSNRDFNSLHYLYSEEEKAYRVDLCYQCKSYIKTVDSRRLDYEPCLDLEDIVTIHLDILALEKGYQRPISSPWVPRSGA
jgi:FdhE protein